MADAKWQAVGLMGRLALRLWEPLKPLVQEARDRWKAPEYRSNVFGSFSDEGTSIVAGRLTSNSGPDPEDHRAVSSFVWSMVHDIGEEEAERRLEWATKSLYVDENENIFSIGGPRSSPFSKGVGYFLGTESARPALPVYFVIDEGALGRGDVVRRKFLGRDHTVGVWKIHAEGKEELGPDMNPKRWLESDYLLVTMAPNLRTTKSKANCRVHCMISGMYGPGVMALDLLLKNVNGGLRQMDEARTGRPYFQSVFKIHGVRHDEPLSRGRDIEHLFTIPLEERHFLTT